MEVRIPFCKAEATGKETEYVDQAMHSGSLSGNGRFTKMCEKFLTKAHDHQVLLTSSGTSALELMAMLLPQNIKKVVMPSFTFTSSANAFLRAGKNVVLVDVDPGKFVIDVASAANVSFLDPTSLAVLSVSYGGVPAMNLDKLPAGMTLIEDNAHSAFMPMTGRMAALSFHQTKDVQCGEGGALIIEDPETVTKARMIREKGTDRDLFFAGLVSKYTWRTLGGNMLMPEMSAAYLFGQLEEASRIWRAREAACVRYADRLKSWMLPNEVFNRRAFLNLKYTHMFELLMPNRLKRDTLIQHLAERGISAAFHYVPLHMSDMGKALGYHVGQFPESEKIFNCLLRLPLYCSMSNDDVDYVCDAVEAFSC